MEKILVRTFRGAQRNGEGQSMTYNRRGDLLVLNLEVEGVQFWGPGVKHPHQVDAYPDVIVVSARAFCLGDESGGQIGRPLDEITLPAPLGKVMEVLNYEDYSGDPGFWQSARILGKGEVLETIANTATRRGVAHAVVDLVRRDWGSIPNLYLSEELVERIQSLCEPVK